MLQSQSACNARNIRCGLQKNTYISFFRHRKKASVASPASVGLSNFGSTMLKNGILELLLPTVCCLCMFYLYLLNLAVTLDTLYMFVVFVSVTLKCNLSSRHGS